MQFFTNINLKALPSPITYHHKILLIGSCFTEHIGNYLSDVKFRTLQNPNGILFDPISVSNSILSYIENKQYQATDLFYHNEVWHSWQHHSRFSGLQQEDVLAQINKSQSDAHIFLKEADWVMITLGSSFVYKLIESEEPVANCHKMPAQTFKKHLSTISETEDALRNAISQLMQFNPELKIMLTISPVRHLRDGVIDNNRSKARLIEVVHSLSSSLENVFYFPAYELVIDVLRDYRFFDIDLAHPNYAATQFVLEKFAETCFESNTRTLMEEIKKLVIARNHKPFHAQSQQHITFLNTSLQKTIQYQSKYPFLDFSNEINSFTIN